MLYCAISQNINSLGFLYQIIYLTFFFIHIVFSSIFLCCFNISNIIITIIYIVYIIIIACIIITCITVNYIIITYFIIIYIIISCDIIYIIVIIIYNITDIIIAIVCFIVIIPYIISIYCVITYIIIYFISTYIIIIYIIIIITTLVSGFPWWVIATQCSTIILTPLASHIEQNSYHMIFFFYLLSQNVYFYFKNGDLIVEA